MSKWLRLYTDVLDDPKVQRLPGDLFKIWVNLLCLTGRHEGSLPSVPDIAFALRMEEGPLIEALNALISKGLIEGDDTLRPHNWDSRQFKSDLDPTAAERQKAKRIRDKEKAVTRDESVTSHPPEADTEQIQNRAEAEQTGEGRAAACVEIGKRITDAMGVTNDPRWLGNWSTVSVWLSQGFDPELDILPTVMATVDRMRRSNKAMPGSLKYFSRAIEENHKARIASGESPAQRVTKEFCTVRKGSPSHRDWMEYYRRQGRKMAFYEAQELLTVPTEFPPQEQAA
jgi:hypothetical protein